MADSLIKNLTTGTVSDPASAYIPFQNNADATAKKISVENLVPPVVVADDGETDLDGFVMGNGSVLSAQPVGVSDTYNFFASTTGQVSSITVVNGIITSVTLYV